MSLPLRNGRVEIEAPSDEQAKHCARILKEHSSSVKSLDLRRGSITSAGASAIAKSLKGVLVSQREGRGLCMMPGECGVLGCARLYSIGNQKKMFCVCGKLLSACGATERTEMLCRWGLDCLGGRHRVCLLEAMIHQERCLT